MDEDPNAWLLKEFLTLDAQGQRCFLSSLVKSLSGAHLHFLYDLIAPGLPLDPLGQLPPNTACRILKACGARTAMRVGRVCRAWSEMVMGDAGLWKYYFKSQLKCKVIRTRLPGEPTVAQIQEAFKQEHELQLRWQQGQFRRIHLACHGNSVVTCLEIDEANGRLFSGSEDHTVGIWRIDRGRGVAVGSLAGHRGGVWAMRVIPEAATLITGSTDRSLIVWDLGSMTMRHQMLGHVSTVRCLEVWRDLVVSGSRDGSLRVWNWRTGELLHHISTAHSSSVRCLALFGEGLVASGSYDNTCALWDIRTGTLVQRFLGHTDKIYTVACRAGRIFSGSMDGTVRMWSAESSQAERLIYGHRGLVGNLQVQGDLIASASTDGAIKVWDVKRAQPVLNLPAAHPTSITTIDMNRWALATGSEGCCRLWDPVSGRLISDYTFAAGDATALSSLYGLATVWRVALGETLCAVAYRCDASTYLDIYDYSQQ